MKREANLKKVALDAAAEKYWIEFYKDTGYGEIWVRAIPRKISAAFASDPSKKIAGQADLPKVAPLATSITNEGVVLEGLASFADGTQRAFNAQFDHNGNVLAFTPVEVK